jgi:hypothetical protein
MANFTVIVVGTASLKQCLTDHCHGMGSIHDFNNSSAAKEEKVTFNIFCEHAKISYTNHVRNEVFITWSHGEEKYPTYNKKKKD